MTTYGVSTEPVAMNMDVHRKTFGSLAYPRYFYGPGDHYSWHTGPLAQHIDDGEVPVISFKTWYPADFETLAETAPPCYVIYCHEPEKALRAGTQTINNLVSVYSQMREVSAAYPNVKVASAFNRYQLTHGYEWAALKPVLSLCDVVGVDCYSGDEYAAKNDYATAPQLLDLALDMAAWAGTQLAVPELGVRLAIDNDNLRMADALLSYVDYMTNNDVLWASYFCNKNDNYHLTQAEPLRVWRSAVAATRRIQR